jgi:O-acetyl-ADP-ribose deacetylase (regulator of RNase III)
MTRQNRYWTNPSVTSLARSKDPIRAIEAKARETVLAAAQEGWEGPPFDPFKLAELLKITVVPSYDVLDARTVPVGSSGFQIEFNPNRPLGRIRFSVAHEISHTFFPDCSETVRNRALTGELRDDEWQLELLCNIGAAELLMPTDLGDLEHEPVNIENLLRLRKEYDVSAEALCLRVVKLTDRPCAMFAAARPRRSEDRPVYRIDYSIPSRTWPIHVPQGLEVSDQTVVAGCTAVGYTAKGQEQWHPTLPSFMVECVGIPPYPDHRFPRVVGVLSAEDGLKKEAPRIINLIGDATEPRGGGARIIAHVVNDRTPRWGGGFALEVRKKWRFVQDDFIQWVELKKENLALGNIHLTPISENLSIIHMIAQHGYGPSAKPRIRYTALRECLSKLATIAANQGASVHMPRIGAGQAGGNWGLIRNLIDEELTLGGIRVAVYDLPDYVPAEVQRVMNL